MNAIPDRRLKSEDQKGRVKKAALERKYKQAKKKRLITKLKAEYPRDVTVEREIDEPLQPSVPAYQRISWPSNELKKGFVLISETLKIYSPRELAEAAYSVFGVKKWSLLWHPDKLGRRWRAKGFGLVTDADYIAMMQEYPSNIHTSSTAQLKRYQSWFQRHLRKNAFSAEPDDPPERHTRIVMVPRWATDEEWEEFILQEANRHLQQDQQAQANDSDNDF
jgi:hypothetical protein